MVSLEILFSYTALAAVLSLVAVGAASYAGATLALKRFFGDEYRESA